MIEQRTEVNGRAVRMFGIPVRRTGLHYQPLDIPATSIHQTCLYRTASLVANAAVKILAIGNILERKDGRSGRLVNDKLPRPCLETAVCQVLVDDNAPVKINAVSYARMESSCKHRAGSLSVLTATLCTAAFACDVVAAEGLQSVLNANAASQVRLPKGLTYHVDTRLTVPAGIDADFNGGKLRITRSNRSSAFLVHVEAHASVRNLKIEVPAGVKVNRVMNLANGSKLFNVEVLSVEQQANTGSQEHAALNIHGSNTRIDGVRVKNFDSAIRCEGGSEFGIWSNVSVSSYLQAFDIYDCARFSLAHYFAVTRSPNARTSPGHNGLTLRGVQSAKFTGVDIRDAGEHGIYIAGSPKANRELDFIDVAVSRPGQCGLKIRNTAARASDIRVDGLEVIDAHHGNKAGWNEDGLRIEQADGVTVTGFSVRRSKNRRWSAHDGIFISDSSDIHIVAPEITEVANYGIRLDDGGNPQVLRSIVIETPRIRFAGSGGLYIGGSEAGTELGDIVVSDASLVTADAPVLVIDAADGNISAPVRVTGRYSSTAEDVYRRLRGNHHPLLDVRLEAAE